MTTVLKAAVIGTGVISKEHLSFLAASPHARLVGVCDLSRAAARYAAQRYGADAPYTDFNQMLAEAKPDVVHILTPPQSHKFIATACLKAGAHVICEKPIASNYQDFQELWAVAQECDRALIEDQNYRFNEPILAIHDLVTQGKLGHIEEIEVRMSLGLRGGGRFADENLPSPIHKMPAGVIHDLITHLVYLALPYLPNFDYVRATWNNHGGGDLFKYDDLDAIVIGDNVHARFRFSCTTMPEGFHFRVRGTEGYAETDLFQPYIRAVYPRGGKQLSPLVNHWCNGLDLMKASVRNFRRKIMQRTPYEGLKILLDRTYTALINGTPLPISYEDMERTSRLIDALVAEENQR
jgi:predicted dehydrogenase